VVKPYDVAFREARSAVGAAPLLQAAEDFSSVADAVAECRLVIGTTSWAIASCSTPFAAWNTAPGSSIARWPRRPWLSVRLREVRLSNDDLSHCHWLMRIPTTGQDLSMNLGQAVALCLYELARDPKAAAARPGEIRRARGRRNEQITAKLLEVLRHSGYINPLTANLHGGEGPTPGTASRYRGPRRSHDPWNATPDPMEMRPGVRAYCRRVRLRVFAPDSSP